MSFGAEHGIVFPEGATEAERLVEVRVQRADPEATPWDPEGQQLSSAVTTLRVGGAVLPSIMRAYAEATNTTVEAILASPELRREAYGTLELVIPVFGAVPVEGAGQGRRLLQAGAAPLEPPPGYAYVPMWWNATGGRWSGSVFRSSRYNGTLGAVQASVYLADLHLEMERNPEAAESRFVVFLVPPDWEVPPELANSTALGIPIRNRVKSVALSSGSTIAAVSVAIPELGNQSQPLSVSFGAEHGVAFAEGVELEDRLVQVTVQRASPVATPWDLEAQQLSSAVTTVALGGAVLPSIVRAYAEATNRTEEAVLAEPELLREAYGTLDLVIPVFDLAGGSGSGRRLLQEPRPGYTYVAMWWNATGRRWTASVFKSSTYNGTLRAVQASAYLADIQSAAPAGVGARRRYLQVSGQGQADAASQFVVFEVPTAAVPPELPPWVVPVVAAVVSFLALCLVVALVCCCRRRRKGKEIGDRSQRAKEQGMHNSRRSRRPTDTGSDASGIHSTIFSGVVLQKPPVARATGKRMV